MAKQGKFIELYIIESINYFINETPASSSTGDQDSLVKKFWVWIGDTLTVLDLRRLTANRW